MFEAGLPEQITYISLDMQTLGSIGMGSGILDFYQAVRLDAAGLLV